MSVAAVRRLGVGVAVGEPIADGVVGSAERGGRTLVDYASARVDELGALETRLPAGRLVVVVVVDDRVAVPRRYDWTQRCMRTSRLAGQRE